MPDGRVCSLTQDLELPNCNRVKLAHDIWSGWGIDADSQHVVVYTDGSHDARFFFFSIVLAMYHPQS
jgi:hypothetical protein